MAENAVFLREDSIIEIQVKGVQNAASVELMGRKASVFLSQLRAQHKRALVLDDLTEMGDVDEGSRNKVVELGKKLDYDKVAMVSSNPIIKISSNLMFHAMGRADKLKYFGNREDALKWLQEE